MRNRFSICLKNVFCVLTIVALAVTLASAQESVLYSFNDPGGTVSPISNLISDAAANLYGTTFYSGAYGMGTVFKLSPSAGGWTETILHSFNVDGVDGFLPISGVVFDAAGNLYGSTEFGGSGQCSNGFGCGTVFKLSPNADGSWTETILHEFQGVDGFQVYGGVVLDAAGNLYGTAANGGNYKQGVVYELSPTSNGHWTGKVLHHFTGGADGGVPFGGVTLDATGNVYGLTSAGGGKSSACRYGCGVAYELSAAADGHWSGKVLHNFTSKSGDGHYPYAGLTLDAAGNLYGVTSQGGGPSGGGLVFELTRDTSGFWHEKQIYNFNEKTRDGINPSSTLIFDAAGNLYGTTIGGGANGKGTAFKLSPASSVPWTETILYSFSDQGSDGYNPGASLLLDAAGNLLGSTDRGGAYGMGAVFEVAQ